MSDAARLFKISVDLMVNDKSAAGLPALLKMIGDLREHFDRAKDASSTLGTNIEGANKQAIGLLNTTRGIADQMERAANAAGRMHMPGGGGTVSPEPGAPPPPSPGVPQPVPGNTPVPGRPVPGAKPAEPMDVFGALGTIQFGADMTRSVVKTVFGPAFDMGNDQAKLEARLTSGQVSAAMLAARQAQTALPATSVAGNIDVYRMLLSLTQDPDKARTLLPQFLPLGLAFQHFDPDGGDYAHQLEAVGRSTEFKGLLAPDGGPVDAKAAAKVGEMLLRADVISKGRVGPDKFLRFLLSAGTAGATMSMDDLPLVMPLLQAMTPQQAGTALKGFNQQFGAGRMSEAAAQDTLDMGLIAGGGKVKDSKFVRKMGMGNYMLMPGGLPETATDQILFHPAQFIHDTLLPHATANMASVYGKQWDGFSSDKKTALEVEEMQRIASRIPGGTMMGEIVRNWTLSQREVGAMAGMSGKDIVTPLLKAPSAQIDGFANAINHLLGVLGEGPLKSATQSLGMVTAAVGAINKVADDHPAVVHAATTAGWEAALPLGIGAGLRGVGWGLSKAGLGAIGGGALSAGKWIGRRWLPVAGAEAVNSLDADDGAGKWIDKHVPGAAAVDDWFYRASGGAVGRPYTRANPLPVVVTNPQHDPGLALSSPPAGSPDNHRSTPTYPGRH